MAKKTDIGAHVGDIGIFDRIGWLGIVIEGRKIDLKVIVHTGIIIGQALDFQYFIGIPSRTGRWLIALYGT